MWQWQSPYQSYLVWETDGIDMQLFILWPNLEQDIQYKLKLKLKLN